MDETLHRVFGFTAFRKHQRELVSGLHEGRDVFGVMPTGGGKSSMRTVLQQAITESKGAPL